MFGNIREISRCGQLAEPSTKFFQLSRSPAGLPDWRPEPPETTTIIFNAEDFAIFEIDGRAKRRGRG
jgi:hypothetical protein